MWNLGRIVLGAPESSIFDLASTMRGFRFSLDAMVEFVRPVVNKEVTIRAA
jgi:hypothetical protein